jgi:hypothetical protein
MDLVTSVLKGPQQRFVTVQLCTGQRVLPIFNPTRANVKQGPRTRT